MPRLDRLSQIARNTILALPVQAHDSAPCAPLSKPLSESRIAIVTTIGIHLRDDKPFVPADPSFRVFPSSVTQADVLQSHQSIGFDRTATQQDWNVVFPIDRLRELVRRGELGGLAPRCYSFMGAQRDVTPIVHETAPEVARRLHEDGADAVLLTPT
ncbi:MAG TPA: glycine/sarcosine/betaine reductase selenoprotein B family protein [Dehalococcoidia bacterium]|nr:glycine/sarcosine/betaine reductase selenoprotein B family protein [Dehalococcoidia bacterium]